MRVSSTGPISAASIVWQPAPGVHALTVVCKAVFRLRPVESPAIAVPEPPLASELAPVKPRADVIVVGHAHAPHGQPVTSLVARITMGDMDKAVEVHGDRRWSPEKRLTPPVPWTTMDLRWERAAGGPGSTNPVGVPPDPKGIAPVPNLLPVGTTLVRPGQMLTPAGFGPIAPSWPGRAALLGASAAWFPHDRWAEQALPPDLDPAYFNEAPPDQQRDVLAPGERLLLEHLHPEHPRLVTVLEPLEVRAALSRDGGAPKEIPLRCDTLRVDADSGCCALLWRGAVRLRRPAEDGAVVVTAERPEADDATLTLVKGTAPPLLGTMAPRARGSRGTLLMIHLDAPSKETSREKDVESSGEKDVDEEETLDKVRTRDASRVVDEETTLSGVAAPRPALPFQPAAPPAAAPAFDDLEERTVAMPSLDDLDDRTMVPELDTARPTLPFLVPAAAPAAPAPLAAMSARAFDDLAEHTSVPELERARPALPFQPTWRGPERAGVSPQGGDVATSAPALGQVSDFRLALMGGDVAPARDAPEALPVEQYARIKAELWHTRGALDEVLERHGVDEIAWSAHEQRQAEAISREAAEGRCETALALAAALRAAREALSAG